MLFPFEVSADDNNKELFLYSDKYSVSGSSAADSIDDEQEGYAYLCGFGFRTQWIIWRVVAACMGFFFLAAAYVQNNDPDPYLWVPAYTIPCLVSWAVSLGLTLKKYKRLPSITSIKPQENGNNASAAGSPVHANNIELKSRANKAKSNNGHKRDESSPYYPSPDRNNQHRQRQKPPYDPPSQSDKTTSTGNVEASVMIPMYGQANHKLDWLINLHIVYCFALGLWTLVTQAYDLHSRFYADNSVSLQYEEKQLHGNAGRLFSSKGMMGDEDWHDSTEEAKELMGLCLVIAWLSLLRHNNYVVLTKLGLVIGISLTVLPVVAWILIEVFQENTCH